MVNNEVEPDEFYDDTNDDLITEEELEHIHPDLDHNFPSPKMNSVIMTIHQNDPENIIDGPENSPIPHLTPKWSQGKETSFN